MELIAERSANVPKRKGDSEVAFRRTYAGSNHWVRARTVVENAGTNFTAEVEMPEARGRYFVRVYIVGKDGAAMASRPVRVVRAKETK